MISCAVATFLAAEPHTLVEQPNCQDTQRFRGSEPQRLRAWAETIRILRTTLADWPDAATWRLLLEYDIQRLGHRIDAVPVTPRAVLVLEFKNGATAFASQDRAQVEDYAIDLQDFHPASRHHPIVPILIATDAAPRAPAWPLLLAAASPVLDASATSLGPLLRGLWQRLPITAPLDVTAWEHAPYRPVPGIIEAARKLYTTHDVADLATARADARNLTVTTDAILAAIRAAEAERHHAILFITGIPGAGKTLCGLNAVFGTGAATGAVFLTGNPSLVHVLREALARDAATTDPKGLRGARQRMESAVQALPLFRDDNLTACC
jgi:hypothetical protein